MFHEYKVHSCTTPVPAPLCLHCLSKLVQKPCVPGCAPSTANKPNPYADKRSATMHHFPWLFVPKLLLLSKRHPCDNAPYLIYIRHCVAEETPLPHRLPKKTPTGDNPSCHIVLHLEFVSFPAHADVLQNDANNPKQSHRLACTLHEANESRLYNKERVRHIRHHVVTKQKPPRPFRNVPQNSQCRPSYIRHRIDIPHSPPSTKQTIRKPLSNHPFSGKLYPTCK